MTLIFITGGKHKMAVLLWFCFARASVKLLVKIPLVVVVDSLFSPKRIRFYWQIKGRTGLKLTPQSSRTPHQEHLTGSSSDVQDGQVVIVCIWGLPGGHGRWQSPAPNVAWCPWTVHNSGTASLSEHAYHMAQLDFRVTDHSLDMSQLVSIIGLWWLFSH